MGVTKFDFSGWATKNDLKCSDGRTIRKNAFKDDDGRTVPLVWQHQHDSAENVLGHALLENRDEGVYAYCVFNGTDVAKHAKELVRNGDITSLSIHANRLKQDGGNVLHGCIREVSLVLAGANPGALIDFPLLQHSDGSFSTADDEATIYVDIPIDPTEIEHADAEEKKEETDKKGENMGKTVKDVWETFTEEQKQVAYLLIGMASSGKDPKEMAHADAEEGNAEKKDGKTVKEIFNTLNEEQKNVLYFLVGEAQKEKGEAPAPEEKADVKHSDSEEGDDFMNHNVFEKNEPAVYTLSHADQNEIFKNAKVCGSLKTAYEDFKNVLQHSITDIDNLFPDAKEIANGAPEFIKRDDAWVEEVMKDVHKTPFANVKTTFADITEDAARAKGYIKGNQKLEEVIGTLKRATTPQTVYKLQKLDRDDVIDITDFDVVNWIKGEMKVMLKEELARAYLIGDGRSTGAQDKINPLNIRPIWGDNPLYTINTTVTFAANATDYDKCMAIIKAVLRARKDYKGAGTPTAFFDPDTLTTMLLATDKNGRMIYKSVDELAAALRVKKIVEVPVLEGQTRSVEGKTHGLLGIIVNLKDYNVGANKLGETTMFDDFDINFNKYEYLIETRQSGALARPYSAITIEVVEGE